MSWYRSFERRTRAEEGWSYEIVKGVGTNLTAHIVACKCGPTTTTNLLETKQSFWKNLHIFPLDPFVVCVEAKRENKVIIM
jgi:hypothetical protein